MQRSKKYLCSVVLLMLSVFSSSAQNNPDSVHFIQTLGRADTYYKKGLNDSAFTIYQQAFQWATDKNILHYYGASRSLLYMGHCLFNNGNYPQAHQYYYKTLLQSRKYNHHRELKNSALRLLYQVHSTIQQKDDKFEYPPVSDYSQEPVYYTIDSVIYQRGDSALVQINAGAYDGIVAEKNQSAELHSAFDASTNAGAEYAGSVRITGITNNKILAIAKPQKGELVQPGWQAKLITNVPAKAMQSFLKDAYLLNFNWATNDLATNLFNRRFFYYYTDNSLVDDIIDLLRVELNDVITRFAADTLKAGNQLGQTIDDGIFTGKNVIRSLKETTNRSAGFFINFMSDYYGSYSGKRYRFSETYATWVRYKTILSKKDIKRYILGDEKKSADMIMRAEFIASQAEANNMPAKWVDEGLELIDMGYWDRLLSQSRLMYHYGVATKRKDCIGWSNFFDAVRRKAFGHVAQCDSFLKAAYQNFQSANSAEGMQWVRTAGASVLDTMTINLNIQSSHILEYKVYPSPNKRYFATGSDDFTIKIWDIQLGKQVRTIQAHTKEVTELAYNPGGRYLASLSADSSIKIWNTFNYAEMFSFKPPHEQHSIKFSPDGQYLVSSGYDSTVNFWEPFTGKLARSFRSPGGFVKDFSFNPVNANALHLVCTDSALYRYDLKNNSFKRELKSGNYLVNFFFSNDGKYSCYQEADSTINIIHMTSGKILYSDKVFAAKNATGTYYSDGSFSPDNRYFVYCGADSNTVIVNLQQWKSLKLQGGIAKQKAFNSDGSFYITQYGGNPAIVNFSDFDWDKTYSVIYGKTSFEDWFEVYKYLEEKEFKNESAPVLETRFSADDRSLHYISWGTHRLDFSTGKSEILAFNHHWMGGRHQYPQNEDLIVYREFKVDDSLIIYNTRESKRLAVLTIPRGEKISSFAFFNQDNYCLLGGAEGSIACWDIQSKKLLYHVRQLNNNNEQLFSMLVQPGTKNIIAFGSRRKPVIIDGESGDIRQIINIEKPGLVAFSGSKLFLTGSNDSLFYADTVGYIFKKVGTIRGFNGQFGDMRSSHNGKYLYILDAPHLYAVDTKSMEVVNRFKIDGVNMGTLSVSHNDSMIAIGSFNGHLTLLNPLTGKNYAKVYFPFASDCILTDSNGHYLASKKALQTVVFNYGNKSFNYDQFDLQLNQPHKVLAAIGVADSLTIQAYEKAYKKRLQRNGLADVVMTEGKIPSISLLDKATLRPTTSQEFYTISAQFYDFKHKLSSIKVFVNDVPVIDSTGQWSSLDTVSKVVDIKLPLTSGNNRVKLYCINQLGLSSHKEIFDIYCTAKKQKQTTWFIGLGVSQYADASNNLVYSAKDIRDMARSFKKMYPDMIIDTLINKQVTLKNIESLKQRLKKIKVTDRVIMAVTGHGLLSDSLDFYYATHDVDFKKPEQKGLKYDQLESILNNTAARQKLLLIDACHSGMIDKEDAAKNNEIAGSDTSAIAKKVKGAKGLIVKKSSRLGGNNEFNLMQNLFADFSNDNGIVVISAAGGLEYAFESEKWRNGVFTYCVLKGLEEKEPDKRMEGGNEDGKISVQELMRYVSNKVPELTKGKQQPTSRRENLDFDWIIR